MLRNRPLYLVALAALLAPVAPAPAFAGLTFNFVPVPGTPANVLNGFQQAADIWSSVLADDAAINVAIRYRPMSAGVLGETASERKDFTYSSFLGGITADRTSASDFTAVSHLSAGPAFDLRINYTQNNPNGVGSPIGYLDNDGDANNTTIRATRANAKALGLIDPNHAAIDGFIEFSSNFNWDFDRSNGITAGTFDFVGVAVHEIGHMLGFNSGVGTLDANSPDDDGQFQPDDWFDVVHPMDLFRFSTDSIAYGNGVVDFTAGNSDKYFSIDGGTTKIASFSTGSVHGDGRQTSHWKDNLGIGIMDPTISSGTLADLTANDLLLFDTIGWDLASVVSLSTPVPEPASLATLGAAALLLCRRSQRVRASGSSPF